jgi:hypothetical protein
VLYREGDNGAIENSFRMHLTNASEQASSFRIEVSGLPGIRVLGNDLANVPAAGMQEVTLTIQAEPGSIGSGSHPIVFASSTLPIRQYRLSRKPRSGCLERKPASSRNGKCFDEGSPDTVLRSSGYR